MSSPIWRLVSKLESRIGWSHAVTVLIAGEAFLVDSSASVPREANDYDYAWLRALAGGKRCILDIGPNVGVTALLLAAHVVPGGKCVLIDVSVDNLRLAARNLDRSRLLRSALFAQLRMGEVTVNPPAIAASTVVPGEAISEAIRRLSVLRSAAPAASIDAMCMELSLGPDLIKIDVEGAEQDVLRGASSVVRRYRPAIQVELHRFPPMTMPRNADETLQWCAKHGYRAWYLALGEPLDDPEQIAARGRCHVLLLPADCEYPDVLTGIRQGDATLRVAHTNSRSAVSA